MRWRILNRLHEKTSESDIHSEEVVKILLASRGLRTQQQKNEFLHPTLHILEENYFKKKELEKALGRIASAVANTEKIIVYSDYDVDGITGAAILWETLEECGADAMPYVPDRKKEGYGMSKKGIDAIISSYPDVNVIITVDHGITAFEAVEYANQKGIDVVITDHHTIGSGFPAAHAIVHTTVLAGSGVALVFSHAIRRTMRGTSMNWNIEHVVLASLGTIGDVVPLTGPNRAIAKCGLAALNSTKRIGLRALIDASGLTGKTIGAYEVGFVIAPRINASGRLTHALTSLQLLCTQSQQRARALATLLEETNRERQMMMNVSHDHAKSLVTQRATLLFVAHESYHEGIIGLIAGRLVEEYYRPAIVISRREQYSKASARSVAGFNIVEAIRSCSDILVNVGGHPMAAGFTVETRNIDILKSRLTDVVEKTLSQSLLTKVVSIDMEIPFSCITKKLCTSIERFTPFGAGNPEPVFATRAVRIVDIRQIGSEGRHVKFKLEKNGVIHEAIGFGMGVNYSTLSHLTMIDTAYAVSLNLWNGNSTVQLKLKDIVPSNT